MTKTRWIASAALAMSLAAAACAQPAPPPGEGPHDAPKTRAELQAKIAEHFKTLDTNKDGFITKAEADAGRAKMREARGERREERRGEHFAMLDKDKNGALSKDEFMTPPPRPDDRGPGGPGGPDGDRRGHGKGMRHPGGGFGMGGRGDMFARADANKDGKISLAEAQAGPLAMFDKIDSNKDGKISPQEHDAARDAMRAKWKDARESNKG